MWEQILNSELTIPICYYKVFWFEKGNVVYWGPKQDDLNYI